MNKKKKLFIILICILLIFIAVVGILFVIKKLQDKEKNMNYKFEDDKLYFTSNAKDWIEVPGDFSYTAEHLKEINNGRYKEGTYQMDNKKIVFYYEFDTNDTNYEGLGISNELIMDLKGQYSTHIVYSDDKGKTWNDVVIGVGPFSDALVEIHFENKNEGTISQKGRDGTTIYYYETTDGGMNWNNC